MQKRNVLAVAWVGMMTALPLAGAAQELTYQAGHNSLQHWLMPEQVPTPEDNPLTEAGAALGKKLFFDPRLSGAQNMSCASCHSPMMGWSDGLATARGSQDRVLGRASMTIVNTAFNKKYMWDGRFHSLEEQAIGPMVASVEMNVDINDAIARLKAIPGYVEAFNEAYPDLGVSVDALRKAIASFERTVISDNSPFDQWVRGDSDALTPEQINGFKVFMDPDKGNCAGCHSAPNFTDNGFHNLGLASQGQENPDPGRYAIVPIAVLEGAFKTPTLRDVELRAPYFHDGSASTLMEVVEFYETGGLVRDNVAPGMKALDLTQQEREDLVAFMKSLTSPQTPYVLPTLPR